MSDSVLEKKIALEKLMLDDMEKTTKRLLSIEPTLIEIESLAMNRVKSALEEKTMNAYKGAVAYAKLVDTTYKLQKMKIEIYDRLQGNIGLFGAEDEEPELPVNEIANMAMQRTAEKLVAEIGKREQKEKELKRAAQGQ